MIKLCRSRVILFFYMFMIFLTCLQRYDQAMISKVWCAVKFHILRQKMFSSRGSDEKEDKSISSKEKN